MIATDRATRYLGFLDVRKVGNVVTHRQVGLAGQLLKTRPANAGCSCLGGQRAGVERAEARLGGHAAHAHRTAGLRISDVLDLDEVCHESPKS